MEAEKILELFANIATALVQLKKKRKLQLKFRTVLNMVQKCVLQTKAIVAKTVEDAAIYMLSWT